MAVTTNPEHANRETTFDLLSNPVREAIISALHESETVERERLAERLTTDTDEGARRRTRIALHHNHLPRLADAGLLVYDGETVTATSRLETVVDRVAALDETDDSLTRAE
ncbi:DUF7344 domain-containing protein [Halorussus aquaticus]|uniref:DUF7344 domain-containing protein n=1 Tax=Halorussus aquaticus TaxID=2953748 RepID=A0ABD5Q5G1_9EURY|nr:hypothetical protein [Halorussus aquaticus]